MMLNLRLKDAVTRLTCPNLDGEARRPQGETRAKTGGCAGKEPLLGASEKNEIVSFGAEAGDQEHARRDREATKKDAKDAKKVTTDSQ
jgi:hypothetical protein